MSQFIDYQERYAVQLITLISHAPHIHTYMKGHEYQNPVSFDTSVLKRTCRIINTRIIICILMCMTTNHINVLFSYTLNDIYDNYFPTSYTVT